MTYSSLSTSGSRLMRDQRYQNFAGRGQNAVDFRAARRALGPVTNTVILIVLACLLGLLYLTQVTKTDAYSYSIDKLQTRQTELRHENDDLTLASAQMQSLDRVSASAQATALAPTTPSGTIQ